MARGVQGLSVPTSHPTPPVALCVALLSWVRASYLRPPQSAPKDSRYSAQGTTDGDGSLPLQDPTQKTLWHFPGVSKEELPGFYKVLAQVLLERCL